MEFKQLCCALVVSSLCCLGPLSFAARPLDIVPDTASSTVDMNTTKEFNFTVTNNNVGKTIGPIGHAYNQDGSSLYQAPYSSVSSNDTCSGTSLAYGQSCILSLDFAAPNLETTAALQPGLTIGTLSPAPVVAASATSVQVVNPVTPLRYAYFITYNLGANPPTTLVPCLTVYDVNTDSVVQNISFGDNLIFLNMILSPNQRHIYLLAADSDTLKTKVIIFNTQTDTIQFSTEINRLNRGNFLSNGNASAGKIYLVAQDFADADQNRVIEYDDTAINPLTNPTEALVNSQFPSDRLDGGLISHDKNTLFLFSRRKVIALNASTLAIRAGAKDYAGIGSMQSVALSHDDNDLYVVYKDDATNLLKLDQLTTSDLSSAVTPKSFGVTTEDSEGLAISTNDNELYLVTNKALYHLSQPANFSNGIISLKSLTFVGKGLDISDQLRAQRAVSSSDGKTLFFLMGGYSDDGQEVASLLNIINTQTNAVTTIDLNAKAYSAFDEALSADGSKLYLFSPLIQSVLTSPPDSIGILTTSTSSFAKQAINKNLVGLGVIPQP